jgi:microcystin-dependent protein
MSTPYLGQISMFAGNFAPKNWAMCNGQILSIQQNTALFAVLGTYYGGNGVTTFALPNLQSRLSVHMGQGPGLSNYVIGQIGGDTQVTVLSQSMPSHTHLLTATTATATAPQISSSVLPAHPTGPEPYFYVNQTSPPTTLIAIAPGAIGPAGGNLPHNNMMPSLCITFIIALQGIFPSRN